ncbi:MAG: DUF2520 domain-containing protein [Flavobacteriales bacterium]|nr:DUF2520 domain-containing protein [Flavobacteriales bacterium]
MKIFLAGSGNVATQLGQAFLEAELEITGVWSRTAKHANALAKKLSTKSFRSLKRIPDETQFVIIAVSDDAVEEVSDLIAVKFIVAHTSGTAPMSLLQKHSARGVFYPLQTFTKGKRIDLSNVPICIEATEKRTELNLFKLAESISGFIEIINSEQRERLHLAAVFASNFSNHFYAIAESLLAEKKISFELLKPLIAETAAKIEKLSPHDAQTGPAVRNDEETMNRHFKLLKKHPDLKKLYTHISQRIIETHHGKKL